MAKSSKTKTRSLLPTWDLSDLYSGPGDKRITSDLARLRRDVERFAKSYRGKVVALARSPHRLRAVLCEYEEMLQCATRILTYAELRVSETSSDATRGAFLQKVSRDFVTFQNTVMFFELDLLSCSQALQRALPRKRELSQFSHFLQRLFETGVHRLEERSETLLAEKSLTSGSAWVRFYEQEQSFKAFKVPGKKEQVYTLTEALHNLSSGKARVRKDSARAISQGLSEEARKHTYIYNTLILDKQIDDSLRGYASPEASRHQANEIDGKVVEAMCSEVVKSYALPQRYYRFKRRLLGGQQLYDYDRYAPVTRSEQRIPFSRARDLILDAFATFSNDFFEIAREFFDRRWIDAASRPGKRSGAFCSFVTPDRHPYVFVNYAGTMRDVFTLAHELGHAVHAYLMREQNMLHFDVPLTLAETASVFAEMLLFDHLRGITRSESRLLQMYCSKIEDIIATVYRQVSMYQFEKQAHKARREEGELPPERFAELWMSEQRAMYGTSVVLTKDYAVWWSYISHFIHTPFYVYSYAFGELLTHGLVRIAEGDADFEQRYLKFLTSGGSQSPDAALSALGIQVADRKFWRTGIASIERLLDGAEAIAEHT